MFSRKSFSAKSFSAKSWKLWPDLVVVATAPVDPNRRVLVSTDFNDMKIQRADTGMLVERFPRRVHG